MNSLVKVKFVKGHFFLWVILFACYKLSSQNISIQLFNKTGHDLDSVQYARKYFGKMAKNDSLLIDDLDAVPLDSGFPRFAFYGKRLDEAPLKNNFVNGSIYCAAQWRTVYHFETKYDIVMNEYDLGYVLSLIEHREP